MKTYTEEEYNSGDGMLTTVWGPSIWHFLHTMSFNYPNEPSKIDKTYYRDFILKLEHVLPCKYCRINLKKNFKILPLKIEHMKNRLSFSKYIYGLHEHVNKMLKKKSGLSYDDVRERYEHFRSRCNIKIVKKEKGCTESLYGEKSKCIIKIVPQSKKCNTFQMNKSCKKKRIKTYLR
uniref:thiol oxidase n=1 Tax=viral metagenome TaxID=1070528 RepID=A0A6C0EUX4_9ZZZZ